MQTETETNVVVKVGTQQWEVRKALAVAWDRVLAEGPGAVEGSRGPLSWRVRDALRHLHRTLAATARAPTAAETDFLTVLAKRWVTVEAPRTRRALWRDVVTLVGSSYSGHPREPQAARDTDPRVWVGCLAAYNAGTHHGRWVNLRTEVLADAIDEILAFSPEEEAEEWHICDQENLPAVGRYPSTDELEAWVEAQETYGADVVEAALGVYGEDHWREALDHGGFRGAYDSPEDWAYEVLEASGALAQVPEALRSYVDFEAYARDAACSGLTFVNRGQGVLVFE